MRLTNRIWLMNIRRIIIKRNNSYTTNWRNIGLWDKGKGKRMWDSSQRIKTLWNK